MNKETAENILLGYGQVSINGIPVGLTRGGSSFTVEREVRNVGADGDKGAVKDRIVIDTEEAKLVVNAMEMFTLEEMNKYYSAIEITEETISSTLKFNENDYVSVEWKGKTLSGNSVIISIPLALNMDNLELTLEDKNEVIPELTYTGIYDEKNRDKSTWEITYPKVVTEDGE